GPSVVCRPEGDLLHPQRFEYALAEELIERLPGRDLHNSAQRVEAGLRTICPTRAWLELQRRGSQARNVAGQVILRPAIELKPLMVADDAAGEAGNVSQQIADGDLAPGGYGVERRPASPAAGGRWRPDWCSPASFATASLRHGNLHILELGNVA